MSKLGRAPVELHLIGVAVLDVPEEYQGVDAQTICELEYDNRDAARRLLADLLLHGDVKLQIRVVGDRSLLLAGRTARFTATDPKPTQPPPAPARTGGHEPDIDGHEPDIEPVRVLLKTLKGRKYHVHGIPGDCGPVPAPCGQVPSRLAGATTSARRKDICARCWKLAEWQHSGGGRFTPR